MQNSSMMFSSKHQLAHRSLRQRRQSLLPRQLLTVNVCLLCSLPSRAMDARKFAAFEKQFHTSLRKDAPGTVEGLHHSLQENAASYTPAQNRLLYQDLAQAYSKNLNDNATALTALDEGIEKLAAYPDRFSLLDTKATLLLAMDKAEDARNLLDTEWPQAIAANSTPVLIGSYVKALKRCGQDDRALQVLQQMAGMQLKLFTDDLPPAHVKLLLDELAVQNQPALAESWAKLSFVLCSYNNRALAIVSQQLASAWMAKYGSPAKVSELMTALRNPNGPNPLSGIALPSLDTEKLNKQADKGPFARRVVLSLALGRDHDAMVAARSLMLSKPLSNEGMLEVCRVFKAHDLNFKRANAFLEFCKTGQGDNPVTAFLKETEAGQQKAGGTK